MGIIVFVIMAIFSTLLSSPAALDPGDPFYAEQRYIIETLVKLLPLLVPGGFALAIIVAAMLSRSGR